MPKFIQGGPEIPDTVMRARDEGRLVLFCGAGVSRGTGLPGFRELFEKTAQSLNHELENKTGTGDESVGEDFDREFHHLEKKYPFGVVRRKVIEILSKKIEPEKLALHRCLLELAKSSDGSIRLVTTNYDDRFEQALKITSERATFFDAPALCLAARDTWNGIVHLHGRINTVDDPNGRRLVLTSGDFGRAYMYDAWATRFVVELFRNFVVLFVGYSIEDRILRYLLDALSIESGRKTTAHFALAGTAPGDPQSLEVAWRAKGVEPLLYLLQSDGDARHGKLTETLTAWARHSRTGQTSRVHMALAPMRQSYSPSLPRDDLENVVWALSEPDGTVARELAEAHPAPEIGWLDAILTKMLPFDGSGQQGLLLSEGITEATPENSSKVNWLVGRYSTANGRALKPVEFWIARWLLHHLNKPKVINWIIDNDGVVGDEFARHIADRVREGGSRSDAAIPIDGVYAKFWRIVSWGLCKPPISARADYVLIWASDRRLSNEEWHLALESFRPFIRVSSRFSSRPETEAPTSLKELAHFEIAVADLNNFDGAQTVLDRLREDKHGERVNVVSYSDEVVSFLIEASRLAVIAEVGEVLRFSSWVVPKVWEDADLETGRGIGKIASLVRFCVRQALKDGNAVVLPTFQRLLHFYISTKANLVGRFALWIASDSDQLESSIGLDFLLSNEAEVLWSVDFKPEVLYFLNRRGSELSETQRSKLWQVMRERLLIAEVKTAADRDELVYDVMRRLVVLPDSGIELPADLNEKLTAWLDGRERKAIAGLDEANISAAYANRVLPENADHLTDKSPSQIFKLLLEASGLGPRGHMLSDLFRRAPEKAICVFELIVSEKRLEEFSSHYGIEHAFEDKVTTLYPTRFAEICAILTQLEQPWVKRLHYEVPEFLSRAVAKIPASVFDENLYVKTWQLAWQNCRDEKVNISDGADGLMEAINAPGGRLVEALCSKLWNLEPARNSSLPGDLRKCLELAVFDDSLSGRFGRIVLCSYLVSFHLIDPKWVKARLVPKMQWGSSEAMHLWNAYLYAGRWSQELIADISNEFGAITQNLDCLRDGPRRNFVSIFMFSFIQFPSIFPTNVVQRILAALQVRDVKHMAWQLQRWLRDSKDKAPELWSETIGPFVDQFWPRRTDQINGDTSIAVAKMVCATNVKFPDAVKLVMSLGLLQRAEDTHLLLHNLYEASKEVDRSTGLFHLVEQYTNDVLLLLDKIVAERLVNWEKVDLGKLVKSLEAKGVPQNDPKLERLRRIALTI